MVMQAMLNFAPRNCKMMVMQAMPNFAPRYYALMDTHMGR